MKIVTTEEMRCAEQQVVDAGDATWAGLMDQAGKAVADEVLARLKKKSKRKRSWRILALVGPGNNGGDALVAGRYLREAGLSVTAYLWKRKTDDDPLAQALTEQEGEILHTEDDKNLTKLSRALDRADVVVDGLLGMGLIRPLEGRLQEIVKRVNEAQCPLVLAVDLPTGVHGDTGQVLGVGIQAHVTVTMALPKRGLYQFPGAGLAGDVVVADIGIASDLLGDVKVEVLDVARLRDALPPRPRGAHKGTFGRVLIVAGSLHYTGAPYLAAMGAYRIGAGLVTLASPRTIYPALAAKAVEPTFLPLPEFVPGAIGEEAIKPLTEVIDRYQAMVVGCGLGQETETVSFVRRFLQMRERGHPGIGFLVRDEEEFTWELPPLVLDADGLNALAGVPEWWRSLPAGRVVLTPHPGEMARLLGASQEEVLSSRIAIAQRAATTWQQVVVFKGAYSVIAHPDGRVVVNPTATPALATAGTGDVLAGAVAGFLGQGASPFAAALLGVYLHGLAGEILEEDVGTVGGIAGEILERLPLALRRL